MNLKGQDDRIFSSSAIDPDVRLLGSSDVRMSTTGGYELGLGRYFGCGKYALNASYWGLAPSDTFANVSSLNSGALATNLPFNTTSIAAPGTFEGLFVGTTPLTEAFANSPEHRLQRNRDFHNLELNLVWFAIGGAARQSLPTSCSDAQRSGLSENPTGINAPWPQTPCRMRLNFFSGVRWFQFQDELRYSALDSFYQNDVKNDLWGIQSGVSAYFLVTPRWSLWKNVNAGIYSNRSQLDTSAGNSTTLATIVSGGSSNGNFYDYEATRNSTSLIAETSTGLAWHFRRGWTANVGYRVIGASGIATAQSQIPLDFRFPGQSTSIQADDSLILHGAIVGATYNF
jgi:hypothetical protein